MIRGKAAEKTEQKNRFRFLAGANYFRYDEVPLFGYFLSKLAVIGFSFLLSLFCKLSSVPVPVRGAIYIVALLLMVLPVLFCYIRALVHGIIITDALALVVCALSAVSGSSNAHALLYAAAFLISDAVLFKVMRRPEFMAPGNIRYEKIISGIRFKTRAKRGEITKGDTVHLSDGEVCPADAEVKSGEAICFFRHGSISEMPVIFKAGDTMLSGTQIVSGDIDAVFLTDGNESFLHRISSVAVSCAGGLSLYQKVLFLISYLVRAIPVAILAYIMIREAFTGVPSRPDAFALVCALLASSFDAPFLCSQELVSVDLLSKLFDKGIVLRSKSVLSAVRGVKLIVIPEEILRNEISVRNVKINFDLRYIGSKKELLRTVRAVLELTDDPMLVPARSYFSLSGNEYECDTLKKGAVRVGGETGEDVTYSVGGKKCSLVRSYASSVSEQNAFDDAAYEIINIIIDGKHVGYIRYDYSETDFLSGWTPAESGFRIVTLRKYSENKALYDLLVSRLSRGKPEKHIAVLLSENTAAQSLSLDAVRVLVDSKKHSALIGEADVSFVDNSIGAVEYMCRKCDGYTMRSMLLLAYHAAFSAAVFVSAALWKNIYAAALLIAAKTVSELLLARALAGKMTVKATGRE